MALRARITSKGQPTIPKEVRRALGVRKGDSLLFEVDDGEVRVRVVKEPVSFAEYVGIWREEGAVEEGLSVGEVNDHVRELRGHEE